ncbi:MAG: protein translocase subunit SecD [Rickettsiaceae bacterium]|nr:protein translocase subunit SecD [Rickettsiaceae bacterium]
MNKLIKRNLIITILFTIIAIIYAAPNLPYFKNKGFAFGGTVNLGLDLQGGSHLLLKVDINQYIQDQLEIFGESLRKQLISKKIRYQSIKLTDEALCIILKNLEDVDAIIQSAKELDRLIEIDAKQDTLYIKYNKIKINNLKENTLEQSIEIVRMRVDSAGTKEPVIQKQGDEYIVLQVPGEDNPEYLKKILGQTAKLSLHVVKDSSNAENPLEYLVLNDEAGNRISVEKKPIITGDMLTNASATYDEMSLPAVNFSLNTIGARLFGEATKNNKGGRIAIVLDNKILSSPRVNEPILRGECIIKGNFSISSAEDLALLLRAGALPAPLEVVEEKLIGASLGSDSIESGKKAGIIGLCSVMIFMALSYGLLGIFANISLCFSLLYIIAILSSIEATLTLPGIAGLILTIGMAVDANVLIYERIREEVKLRSSIAYAIDQGFSAAFSTISDSNITTLISAALLYIFGTGAIRGFAVSLSVGIICSMFASIIVTRLLVDLWLKYYKPIKLGI